MIVNGVPLDNPAMGWSLTSDSKPLLDLTTEIPSVSRPGRDGVVGGFRGVTSAPVLTLTVDAPASSFEDLVALVRSGGSLARGDRVAGFEYLSHTVAEDPDNAFVQVTFLIRLPGVFWRDRDVSTVSVSLGALSVPVSVFPGMSAPVQDGVIRVGGAATGIQVTDTSGAWLTLPDVAAGEFVRFDMNTGRAWRTVTDTWAGGVEVSGLVNFGGPRGVFEITPSFTGPNDRAGKLTVTTATRSGAVVDVRGRAAYLT